MEKVSAVVITLNEEKNLARCLESVKWADELIVLDSGSTDRTKDIALSYGAKFLFQDWLGYGPQKQAAIDLAANNWCLLLDADEELDSTLSTSIKDALSSPNKSCYKIRRNSYFLGKRMKYGDWGRNTVIRLFDKARHSMSKALVHETISAEKSETGLLNGRLLHYYTQDTLFKSLEKMNNYSSLGAEMLMERGRSVSFLEAYVRGKFAFFRSYVLFLGFLDGKRGFVLAQIISISTYVKYLKRIYDFKV